MKRIIIIVLMMGGVSSSFGQSEQNSTKNKNQPDTIPKDIHGQKRFIIYTGSHVGIGGGIADMKNARASKKGDSWDVETDGQKRYRLQSGKNVSIGAINHPKEDQRTARLLNAGKSVSSIIENDKDTTSRFFISTGKHVGVGNKNQ